MPTHRIRQGREGGAPRGLSLRNGVEGDGGVALLVETGAGEASVAVGGLEALGGVFGEDEGVWREDGVVGGAAEETKGLGVVVFGVVRWVEEDDVERGELGEALQQGGGSAVFEGVAGGNPEGGEIGSEGFERGWGFFREEDVGGSAREGFDADGTGAGEKIGEPAVGDARGEDVEEGFAEAVAGGAG